MTGPGPHTPPPPPGPGRPTQGKAREALVLGLAQNAILVGLVILAAGVPTW